MPRLTLNFVNTKVVQPDNGKVLFYRDDELLCSKRAIYHYRDDEVKGFGLKVTRGSMTIRHGDIKSDGSRCRSKN